MMNDLRIHDVPTWKYVDDSTIAEIIPRDGHSDVQRAVIRLLKIGRAITTSAAERSQVQGNDYRFQEEQPCS